MNHNEKLFSDEEIELNGAKRAAFCNTMMSVADGYLLQIGHNECLVVNQDDDMTAKFLRIDRFTLANVYERLGAIEISNLLREPPVIGTAIICFNAYNGFKAFHILRKDVVPIEA